MGVGPHTVCEGDGPDRFPCRPRTRLKQAADTHAARVPTPNCNGLRRGRARTRKQGADFQLTRSAPTSRGARVSQSPPMGPHSALGRF